MEKKGHTLAWKFMCPTISKKDNSVHWDWSNEQDGIRVFEVFCADLTGHPSYIIMRITRDNEADCRDELRGQITDGFFENYCGSVRGKEIDPDSLSLDLDKVRKMLSAQHEIIEFDHKALQSYRRTGMIDTLAAAMSGLGLNSEPLCNALSNAEYHRMATYNYMSDEPVSEEALAAYNEALKELTEERSKAIKTLENALKNM